LTSSPSPLATSAGSSAWVTRSVPSTLSSNICCHWAGSVSATVSRPNAPPALLTSTATSVPTSWASRATEAGSVTSQSTAVPPISAASGSMRSRLRAAHTTANPSAPSRLAVAAPMPLLAPVTTAVRR